jgi:cobalt-zinc-cadmium efflux system membrane fusion protein
MAIKGISLGKQNVLHSRWVRLTFVVVLVAGCLGAVALPPVRNTVQGWFAGKSEEANSPASARKTVELVERNGRQGLRVNAEAMVAAGIKTEEAKLAHDARPLAPQLGFVNYDIEHIFPIRPQFPGKIGDFHKVVESTGPTHYRPIRFLDRVKQGDVLAVIWSKELGEKKAALVDAIVNLRLSQKTLDRQNELAKSGSIPRATLEASENQVEKDKNAVRTAELTLVTWNLSREEIDKIKEEAKDLIEQKKNNRSDREKNWARVEVKAPTFGDDPSRELVIVEKNTNQGDMVDPARDTLLFKLADLSRLQIWVHVPPEYLPRIREQLQQGGSLKWQVRFLADPPNTPPMELEITRIAPSVDPNQQRPMLIGDLPNPDGKRLIGDGLKATIFLPPLPNTVEIPTEAINQVDGQDLVFVESSSPNELYVRRVAVVKSFAKTSFVRSKLTPDEEALARAEKQQGRRPLEPLLPGERVVTRYVLELTNALSDALSSQRVKAE